MDALSPPRLFRRKHRWACSGTANLLAELGLTLGLSGGTKLADLKDLVAPSP
jgi:hypothetical protein